MYYLSQYFPDMALVELVFGAIKRKLKSSNYNLGWNFSKTKGKNAIVQWWGEIEQNSIFQMWIMVIQKARAYILERQAQAKQD